jgi:hypothetical protein
MKTQLSLRQLFVCTLYFAVGFALTAAINSVWHRPIIPLDFFIVSFGPTGAAALIGAGVGELYGRAKKGAIYGAAAGGLISAAYFTVFVVWPTVSNFD